MKTIVAILIEKPQEFRSLGSMPDNREGMYVSSIRMKKLTADGEHVQWLAPDNFTEIAHSGLRKTADDAYHGALELARAMRRAVQAMGEECYISTCDECWQGSDEFLSRYLMGRKEENERKTRKTEMIARAKAILAEAKNL